MLAYQRSALLRGHVWQLVTSHFVHASATHLLLNLAGTGVVAGAVAHALSGKKWLIVGGVVATGSSVGVLLLQPDVRVMAGLSALLHGLLATGATVEVRRGERIGWVFLALLAMKITWEQIAGPTPLTRSLLSGDIAIAAHACGTLVGLITGLVIRVDSRPADSSTPPRR